jgi:hypothetical protein
MPTAAAALLATAVLAACGGGDDPTPVGAVLDRDQLEQDISNRLREAGGGGTVPVNCPSDLPTVKDATMRCTAAISGATYGVTVTITGGSGANAEYGLEVDQQPS